MLMLPFVKLHVGSQKTILRSKNSRGYANINSFYLL